MFFRSDVGVSGASETMFYCEVLAEDKVSAGGGVDGWYSILMRRSMLRH